MVTQGDRDRIRKLAEEIAGSVDRAREDEWDFLLRDARKLEELVAEAANEADEEAKEAAGYV